jgi:hypothetical protein
VIEKCWYILWPFAIFCGHWGNFMTLWYIFSSLGIMHQEKSGNPGFHRMQSHQLCTYAVQQNAFSLSNPTSW